MKRLKPKAEEVEEEKPVEEAQVEEEAEPEVAKEASTKK